MTCVHVIARRQMLQALVNEARAVVRSTRSIHDRFEYLAGHAGTAKERVDFARTADEWASELEADSARLRALETELIALDTAGAA